MKKLFAVVIIVAFILSSLSVTAFSADNEVPLNEEVKMSCFWSNDGITIGLIRIGFGTEYKEFGDNISIELFEKNTDNNTVRKCDAGNTVTAVEKINNSENEELVLYIKNPGCKNEGNTRLYAIVGENSVFDSNGNGNSTFRINGDWEYIFYDYHYYSKGGYIGSYDGRSFRGDRVEFKTVIPVDIYVNGELADNDGSGFIIYLETGEYTIKVEKYGILLRENTYNVESSPSKADEFWSAIGNGAMGELTAILQTVFGIVLLPVFPLGTMIAIAFLADGPASLIINIGETIGNLFGVIFE